MHTFEIKKTFSPNVEEFLFSNYTFWTINWNSMSLITSYESFSRNYIRVYWQKSLTIYSREVYSKYRAKAIPEYIFISPAPCGHQAKAIPEYFSIFIVPCRHQSKAYPEYFFVSISSCSYHAKANPAYRTKASPVAMLPDIMLIKTRKISAFISP